LAEKIDKVSSSELADIINHMDLTASEKGEVLRMLPDKERTQVRMIMSEPVLQAPTRGMPKAIYQPKYLRRKKAKAKKKVVSEPMLVGTRL